MDNLFQGTLENFKELVETQDKVILVDFYAEWCAPCRNLSPLLDSVAEKYENIIIVKVDVDKNGELGRMQPYNVKGIPNIFLIKNGEVLQRMAGPQTMDKLSAAIDPLMN